VTPLSMIPDQRTHNKHLLLLAVPPGPRQPVDLESFLHPIAEALNRLAKGVPGLIVANSATPQVLRAGVLNFTTDQPGGDMLMNAKGVNSYVYNRLRIFEASTTPQAAMSNIYPEILPRVGRTRSFLRCTTAQYRAGLQYPLRKTRKLSRTRVRRAGPWPIKQVSSRTPESKHTPCSSHQVQPCALLTRI